LENQLYKKVININNFTQGGVLTARVMAESMSSLFKSFKFKHPEYKDDFQITIGEIDTKLEYWIDGPKKG